MTTSPKRAPRPAVKHAAKGTAPGDEATARPYLRFHHSVELRERTERTLVAIESAADVARHREALAELVVELTSAGMDYYFIEQLKLAKVGFIVQQSANVGVIGAMRVMGSVIRGIIGRMDRPQLLSVCDSLRRLSR